MPVTAIASRSTDRQRLTAFGSFIAAAVLMALAAVVPGLGDAFADAGRERLRTGERLHAGQLLRSPDGSHTLELQKDGNLVVYAPGHRPIWETRSRGAHSVLVNQPDGNMVLIAEGNRPIWATGTQGRAKSELLIQNDGNLVVYAPGNRAIWASRQTIASDIVSVGRMIQKMGFTVSEHPAFGGVGPGHAPKSYHYRDRAIDVNFYPRAEEAAKLDELARWIRANIRHSELLWRVSNHYGHLHLAV